MGMAFGTLCGLLLWVVYFVQASVISGLFWDVFVIPAFGVVALAVLSAAAMRRSRRSWWLGFTWGALLMVPLAAFAFMLLFAILGLE